jgi:tRNA(Ile)-lysidine synthase
MTILEQKLGANLRLPPEAPLVVAASGGADSTALLDALTRRHAGRLTVAHLNHSLRGAESDEDEAFVVALAARDGLPCLVEREQIAALAVREGRNLEAVARERRYAFLARAALSVEAAAVVTAHTRDDQVETILLRLSRGTGPAGLRGIERQRRLGELGELGDGVLLIRPLLAATRREVLEHCAHYGIEYRTDSSNFSPSLSRNRLRLEALPVLRALNPRFDEALLRTVSLISEDEDYLNAEAKSLLAESDERSNHSQTDASLDVRRLAAAPAPLRRRALRIWLHQRRGHLRRIDATHLAALEALALRGHSGQRIEIPGGGRILKEFTRLVFLSVGEERAEIPAPTPLIEGTESAFGAYRLKLQRYLQREAAEAALEALAAKIFDEVGGGTGAILRDGPALDGLLIRARRDSDAYIPAGAEKPVKLKKIMLRARLPQHIRAGYPLLATAADEIVWGPKLPIARGFQPVAGEECALISVRRVDVMQPDGLIGRL